MQLCDKYIDQVPRWKQQGEQPPSDFVKTQPVPLHCFIQQWDQLVLNNGILYNSMSHQVYLQLVVPTEVQEVQESILRELHEGDTWVKTKLSVDKKDIIGQDISKM